MKELLHKYIGSFFWAIRNKKRLGGYKIRLTDEGWAVCLPDIVLSTPKPTKEVSRNG